MKQKRKDYFYSISDIYKLFRGVTEKEIEKKGVGSPWHIDIPQGDRQRPKKKSSAGARLDTV